MAKRTRQQQDAAEQRSKKAPRAPLPERRAELQDEAFDAGKAAYAEGVGRDAGESHYPPADDLHDLKLAQHWQQGWDAGLVAVERGAGVPLYSQIPSTFTDPEACIAAARGSSRQWKLKSRDAYAALPITMGELPGTTWVNLWTGTRITIARIEANGWGKPVPIEGSDLDRPHPGRERHRYGVLGIGLWWYDRYLIENWVRFDTLPPEAQLRWLLVPVRRAHESIATARAQVREYDAAPHLVSCYSANRNLRLNEIARGKESLAKALETARHFADQHGLFVSPDELNAAILGEDDEQPSEDWDSDNQFQGENEVEGNEDGEDGDDDEPPSPQPSQALRKRAEPSGEAVQLYLL
jgi:hypothetical protein